jgi:hypothetical protein
MRYDTASVYVRTPNSFMAGTKFSFSCVERASLMSVKRCNGVSAAQTEGAGGGTPSASAWIRTASDTRHLGVKTGGSPRLIAGS